MKTVSEKHNQLIGKMVRVRYSNVATLNYQTNKLVYFSGYVTGVVFDTTVNSVAVNNLHNNTNESMWLNSDLSKKWHNLKDINIL